MGRASGPILTCSTAISALAGPSRKLVLLLQATFVVLYSSGFIAGTIVTREAHPLAVIFWRFIIAGSLLAFLALGTRARWPRTTREFRDIAVTGILLQTTHYAGTYLGFGVGISASLSSMILGMMPLLVALGAWRLLREPLTKMQTLGTFLGFIGLMLATVVGVEGGVSLRGVFYTAIGCIGLAAGTLYQRRYGVEMDLRSGGSIQLFVGAVGILPIALLNGGLGIPFTTPVVVGMLWLATANSLGAITLLLYFLKHKNAGEASSLFYLMPGLTAIAAVPLLGQSLHWYSVAGLLLTAIGLLLVSRFSASRRTSRRIDEALAESPT
ncbi:drug/metabolite transporter (DMT)-like permease [Antricoccus suffuscus]|uniref:Drug/metabolite transporter (DMT)-like permease n=1 Tax=Antricoccus suffuscus TaxID=1629062 RepID=A0A2T0Z021_9ACTN|nr:drug/metabolite transporter (DMT)-like permease [Antricoccus suffuscus]